jgi:tRNA wybutosine-synthesizing protein 3
MPYPRVPPTFARKKAKILRDLSVPDTEYSDRSPKGSVDEGIRELIDEINAFEGFVTTSSCAGRISVFQEGHGRANDGEIGDDEVGRSGVPGGKGGGKFLFVSHEPVEVSEDDGLEQLSEIFGGGEGSSADGGAATESLVSEQRFVRFAFEPMVCTKEYEEMNPNR